jgi:RHS repeat-associated protein
MSKPAQTKPSSDVANGSGTPTISLPKGGGAVRGIGEKFAANLVTGTGSLSVPIAASPGRSGFSPQLSLSYDSGSGNGLFGLGWSLALPSITRKTDKGLPRYRDDEESDDFILSGSEDLVPVLAYSGGQWRRNPVTRTINSTDYSVQLYRPRVEGLFARIERWTNVDTGVIHWRSITKDNITTVYGKDNNSRIYDHAAPDSGQPSRIFTWLISESYDDKGNAIVYEYKSENSDNIDLSQANEKNRTVAGRSANRYLKQIKYGNRTSRLIEPDLSQTDWMFKLVFDYGEHAPDAPAPDDTGTWLCRHDPFSVYRAGFEIRTYRLCQRVLMFHNFSDEDGVGPDCLVRSTNFIYQSTRNNSDDLKKGHPAASFISSIEYSGYRRTADGYLKRSMPPLEFQYSQPVIQEEVREVEGASLENLPRGLDGSLYQWVDLDGEGLSGILSEQAKGWFYKRNLSPVSIQLQNGEERVKADFAPAELVGSQPSIANLGGGRQQFLDLAGDGQLDLVQFEGPLSGFYERTEDGDWSQFAPFKFIPGVDWNNPNLKFIDLTGDGRADIIISEDSVFTWYPSLAEAGFGAAERIHKSLDEEKGPRLLFGDGTQSVYLADMSGDGLTDLVRVRDGEVCYWPNLGYGRFGAKVSMDNSPLLDRPELFDQRRIRLADVDGSGVTDLLYLASDGAHIYFNQSGNSWDDGRKLSQLPHIDDQVSVTAVDLLGNGTTCLVWSSSLPGVARRPMRYIDLMGGRKPHLLIAVKNNMGLETGLRYAPSTKFYLEDKLAGRPWMTRLPFPVHVVERVETIDRVSRNRFVSRYAYHHGYFDGEEREFRGFGMVEQWDTEEIGSMPEDETSPAATNLDAASFVPPIHIKTWFHTGVYLGRDRIANYFAGLTNSTDKGEYYRQPGWSDADAEQSLLDDTILPAGLTLAEEREACRALKGAMLRQEVYGLDDTEKAQHPYTVTEQNFTIERLQPQASNRHAVFFTHARETLGYHYERNPHHPRIGHTMTLETDKYGNVMKSVSIGYGRNQSTLDEPTDRDKQTQALITYVEQSMTFAVDSASDPDNYRAPLQSEERTFELTGYEPASAGWRFQISDFVKPDNSDAEGRRQLHLFDGELEYQEPLAGGRERRLIEHVRTLYRKDDLSGLLPPRGLESLALPGQSYKLAFTTGLLEKVYKRKLDPAAPFENLLPDPSQVLGGKGNDEGGYVDMEADGRWWIPSGLSFYSKTAESANPAATAQAELTEARQHFFLQRKFADPFNKNRTVDYDPYDLAAIKTEDALQNIVTALHDYRVLHPYRMTDPNGNRSEVRFDALGMVVGTAVMGKDSVPVPEGDSFDDFNADLTPQQIKDYFDAANPRTLAIAHLGTATTRIIYDIDRVPGCASSIARETHVSDLEQGEQSKVHLSFLYADGAGREAQTKVQAEPGPLELDDPSAPTLDPRWVGTGATIYNNKGKPVRQYEPFFSATHHYGIEQHGVSRTLFYDPASRVVATLHPNHTWEKVVFDPWQQASYDVNDTVLNSDNSTDPKSDEDVKGFFSRLPDADYLPTWYEQRILLPTSDSERQSADKAAVHRQTPTISHLDVLGRAFLVVTHNRFKRNNAIFEESYPTRNELDIEGNQRAVRDAVVQNGDVLGRIVMCYDYDMLGKRIHQSSMEAGERWMLDDVAGKPLRAWNSRGFDHRMEYDELRRTTGLFVTENGVERLAERTIYGESQGATDNHRARIFQVFDGAGILTSESYDFKGNLLVSKRDLASDYKGELDWSQNPAAADGTFICAKTYDALSRLATMTTPDNSVYRPTYNEAKLIDKVEVSLRGETANNELVWTPFVTNVDYDAKGLRTLIHYANGAATTYEYDARTFRLTRLKTTRTQAQNGLSSQIFNSPAIVQDLRYTYDPAGNITRIEDFALPTIFFNGQEVKPACDYTYDAAYRLIEATGREHAGQTAFNFNPAGGDFRDYPFMGSTPNANDLQALCNYTEGYEYDAVGNFKKLSHEAGQGNTWTRNYSYNVPSLVESATKKSNRLSSTTVGQTTENYSYDAHGNMSAMSHLTLMQWDFKNQLHATSRQAVNNGTPETTYYVYDAAGQRARKVTERQNGTRKSERIYLGSFEIYREYDGPGINALLERETLHVMDDKRRIALVETKTTANGNSINQPLPAQRYQLSNHLDSASLELDEDGALLSYEEYHPYGTTAFQAATGAAEVSLKRYRYTGKERDDETGLSYHGARYYAPWLGRWTAVDPAGLVDGTNLFAYAKANPVVLVDPDGHQSAFTLQMVHPRTPADVQAEHRARLLRAGPPAPAQEKPQAQPAQPSKAEKSEQAETPKAAQFSDKQLAELKLTKEQVEFIFKYHQIAKEELKKRGLPEGNASLLVAHAGVETSYGAKGPNPKRNNFLSLQPPPALEAELKKRNIKIKMEDRVNVDPVTQKEKKQPTPTPVFADMRQSIQIQIDLAYGHALPEGMPRAVFPAAGKQLADPKATAESYGTAAARGGYVGVLAKRTPEESDAKFAARQQAYEKRIKGYAEEVAARHKDVLKVLSLLPK